MNTLLTAIAIWYVSRLFIYERGLWNVFGRLRAWLGVDDSTGYPNPSLDQELSYLFSCVICFSFWLSVGVVVAQSLPWYQVCVYGGLVMILQLWSNE